MSDTFDKKKHTVFVENREMLEINGVNDVTAFNEEDITAICDWGDLLIKGEGLHVEALDLQSGFLKITGKITAIVYNEKSPAKGFFKRAFS